MSITNDIVSTKIYDKWDEMKFDMDNFPFLDGDVPRSPSYVVNISQLTRFARVCFNVDDFNNRNKFCLLNYFNKVIDTINFFKFYLNLITDTQS